MEKLKPIKRCSQLAPLSREHHDGLLLCWKIRTGLKHDIALSRISNYIFFFFNNYLEPHFKEEESYLFPLLPTTDKEIIEALSHHNALREMINNFQDTDQKTEASLYAFADLLEKHIRFEERVLFNRIQDETDIAVLNDVARKINTTAVCTLPWNDQFWEVSTHSVK